MGWTAALAAGASEASTPQPLQATISPVERELAGGAFHVYALDPELSGDLLLTVEQQGIDVIVTLRTAAALAGTTPSESDIASPLTVDTPNGRWGNETLLIQKSRDTTADAASYVVEVRSLSAKASPGLYVLELESLASWDARGIAAHRASMEGSRRFHEGTQEARRLALAKYEEAYALWQAIPRPAEEADTLFHIAMLHRYLKQPQEALTIHRRALGLRQQLGDRRGEARSWLEIGSTAWSMGESQHSPGAYTKALEIFRSLDEPHGQARALNYLGLVSVRKDPRRALPFYEEALTLFRRAGDTRQEGVVLNNLGGLQDQLGEPHDALGRYREALAIHQAGQDLGNLAVVWNNMGSTYRRTGRLQEALEYFKLSLDARRQLGDRRGEGRVLNNLGWASLRLGDLDRAETFMHQALDAKREGQDRRGEAITLGNLGAIAAERADWNQALQLYGDALALHRKTSNRSGEATTLIELGRATAELGRLAEAKEHLEEALAILDPLANPWRQALAKAALGQVLTDAGQAAEGVIVLEESLDLLRRAGDDDRVVVSLLALARAQRRSMLEPTTSGAATPEGDELKRRLLDAWRHTEEALDLLESLRTDVDSLGLRMSFLSRHQDAFAQAIDLAMHLHELEPDDRWAARGLEISERSRARSLLDLLPASRTESGHHADAVWAVEQRTLLDRLNAKVERRRRYLKRGGNEVEVERLGAEIVELSDSLEDLENRLRRQSPRWRTRNPPRPLPAQAIQGLIDSDTMLLEYALGDSKSFLWAITRDTIQSFELADAETIQQAARQAYEALRIYEPKARPQTLQATERLSQLLLAPLADHLQNQRLVIVADGATHYIPFAALPRPQSAANGPSGNMPRPLLVDHEIVYLPSASVLGMQRELDREPSTAQMTLAVFADPVFGPSDPRVQRRASKGGGTASPSTLRGRALDRLTWSDWEAQAIVAHAEPDQTLLALGFDANLEALEGGALDNRRIVHFATHGMIDSEHPELSALALSMTTAEGQARPGLLRLPEIYNLELDADLVVLSGCQTALGSEVHGEGLVGLSRGFFAAGARRLVASLWRVQDKATAELMDRFYRRLLSDSAATIRPAAALRAAQLELLNETDYQDPYHWAAFALYGDWR